MSTLFYPIITFFLLAICIAYWAVTAMYPLKLLCLLLHWSKYLLYKIVIVPGELLSSVVDLDPFITQLFGFLWERRVQGHTG